MLISNRGELHDLIESNKVVTLFTAPAWCVPCRRFEPHWNKAIEVAEVNKVDYLFAKVDMGESPEDTGEHWATTDFSILGVPSVKFFYDEDNWRDIKSRAVIPLLKEIESLG